MVKAADPATAAAVDDLYHLFWRRHNNRILYRQSERGSQHGCMANSCSGSAVLVLSLSLLALGQVCGLPVIGDTDDAPPRTSAKRERKCDISIA